MNEMSATLIQDSQMIDIDFFSYNNIVTIEAAKEFAEEILEAVSVAEMGRGCKNCVHSRLYCSSCLQKIKMINGRKSKQVEQILVAGWHVKSVMDCRPELKIQLARVLREIWEMTTIVAEYTAEETLESFRTKG